MIKKTLHKFSLIILSVLVLLLAFTSFYFYNKSKVPTAEDLDKTAQAEVLKLVEKVGKLIVLPEGETPTVATVTDLAALKDQPFFAQAELGDKVLIYSNSKKAILYSVSLNKIIEASPLNVANNDTASTTKVASTTEVKKTTTAPKPVKK